MTDEGISRYASEFIETMHKWNSSDMGEYPLISTILGLHTNGMESVEDWDISSLESIFKSISNDIDLVKYRQEQKLSDKESTYYEYWLPLLEEVKNFFKALITRKGKVYGDSEEYRKSDIPKFTLDEYIHRMEGWMSSIDPTLQSSVVGLVLHILRYRRDLSDIKAIYTAISQENWLFEIRGCDYEDKDNATFCSFWDPRINEAENYFADYIGYLQSKNQHS